MTARFRVAFEDLNYERWVVECGAEFEKLEPRLDGGFDLHISGDQASIETFSRDLGWDAD